MEVISRMDDGIEHRRNGATAAPLDGVANGKKKSKKKSKGRAAGYAAQPAEAGTENGNSLSSSSAALPSQGEVEARFHWRLQVKKGKGRCAIASKAFARGDVVLAETALLFAPRDAYHAALCHCCGHTFGDAAHSAQSSPLPCHGCGFAVFCSECAPSAQARHSALCPLFRALPAIARSADCSPDLLRLLLCMAQAHHGASQQQPTCAHALHQQQPSKGPPTAALSPITPTLQDALSLSAKDASHQPEWAAAVAAACSALTTAAASLPLLSEGHKGEEGEGGGAEGSRAGVGANRPLLPDTATLQRWAAVLGNNVHGMGAHGPLNTDIAVGLFPFVSMLNHSCRPNCCFASQGNTMVVRATCHIDKGAELCVSYINLYESRESRQQQLLESKHFICACDRCSEPLPLSSDRLLE
ncbi:unnamed protein product, partial [Closterium sp. NIES-54]